MAGAVDGRAEKRLWPGSEAKITISHGGAGGHPG